MHVVNPRRSEGYSRLTESSAQATRWKYRVKQPCKKTLECIASVHWYSVQCSACVISTYGCWSLSTSLGGVTQNIPI